MRKSKKPSFKDFPKNKHQLVFTVIFTLAVGFLGGVGYSHFFPTRQDQQDFPTEAVVSRVIDGDTIELDSGQPVRLYAVSCPDEGEAFFDQAKEFTEKQVSGKKIFLEYEERYKTDRFGRLLAYVILPETSDKPDLSQNLNVELVRQGLCTAVIYQKRAKLVYQDELLEAQEQSKEEKLGIWSETEN